MPSQINVMQEGQEHTAVAVLASLSPRRMLTLPVRSGTSLALFRSKPPEPCRASEAAHAQPTGGRPGTTCASMSLSELIFANRLLTYAELHLRQLSDAAAPTVHPATAGRNDNARTTIAYQQAVRGTMTRLPAFAPGSLVGSLLLLHRPPFGLGHGARGRTRRTRWLPHTGL